MENKTNVSEENFGLQHDEIYYAGGFEIIYDEYNDAITVRKTNGKKLKVIPVVNNVIIVE